MAHDSAGSAKNQVGVVVWLVLLLGLVTTALGVAYSVAATPTGASVPAVRDTMIAAVVSSLGAGIIGAALSIVIARNADRASTTDLSATLSRSLTARFSSSADDLHLIRHDWHHYHVTIMSGRHVWRYTRHRLDRSLEVNSLQAIVEITDEHGRDYNYLVEAGVRGARGILFLKGADAGIGSDAVEIFPDLTRTFRPAHFGIGLYETWDGLNIVGKIILSRQPLAPVDKNGTVEESHFSLLDQMWHQGFTAHNQILPDAAPGSLAEASPTVSEPSDG